MLAAGGARRLVAAHPGADPAGGTPGLVARAAGSVGLHAPDGRLDLAVLGDSALRLGHVAPTELKICADQRRRGAPLLRAVVPLLDKRSESAWESIMRVLHGAAGIGVEPQYPVHDAYGRFVARADFWIVGTRRLHEYDGAEHREPEVHDGDLRRDRALLGAGWQRHGFTSRHLQNEAGAIIRDADHLLGRPWDAARLRAWEDLLNASMLRRPGRSRALAHWRRAQPGPASGHCGAPETTVSGRE